MYGDIVCVSLVITMTVNTTGEIFFLHQLSRTFGGKVIFLDHADNNLTEALACVE